MPDPTRRTGSRPATTDPGAERPAGLDPDVSLSRAQGTWGGVRVDGPARLRLTSDALLLERTQGAPLQAGFAEISGADWRTGSLVIHGDAGRVTMDAESSLEDAWVALVERACPLPEFTRSYRHLGSRRGGPPEVQARILAPLLQLRRQVHEERDLERRVAAIDAQVIRQRLLDAIATLANDSYPGSAPDRRGITVELEEALAPLFEGIERVGTAGERFRASGPDRRFHAWREWVEEASRMFAEADRAWLSATGVIPNSGRGRR